MDAAGGSGLAKGGQAHDPVTLSLRPVTVAVGPTGSVLRETLTAPGLQLLAGLGASFLLGHVKASWRLCPYQSACLLCSGQVSAHGLSQCRQLLDQGSTSQPPVVNHFIQTRIKFYPPIRSHLLAASTLKGRAE